ncbi:MAG: class I SAM-dependent methyltransferase [Candidatus Bathyarchaeia archaeon]
MTEHYFTEEPSSEERVGLLKTHLRGSEFEFLTSTGLFSYRRIDLGTRILIENMIIPEEGTFLDLGCGYGPIGIVAARVNPDLEVYMTDINTRAVEYARINVEKNGVNAEVVQGDSYEGVNHVTFNAIASNPPVSAGMKDVVRPMVFGAKEHLIESGSLQMVMRYNKGGRTLESMMAKCFGSVDVLAKKGGYRVFISRGD